MADSPAVRSGEPVQTPHGTIVVQVESASGGRRFAFRAAVLLLVLSVLLNLVQWGLSYVYSPPAIPELFHSGVAGAADRIAVIPIEGTITPPFTARWMRQLDQAESDDSVRGVVLLIDSPGGLVADSNQLYRRVRQLVESKPVAVSMKRITASGGYYMAMGVGEKGRIFAEPTTWTGSIGVIIPRYNAAELARNIGVTVDPLKTGPFKDALNPFRDLSPEERQVWDAILKDAYDRFVQVITDGRSELSESEVRELATGQIYTANQALASGMIDEVGYLEDAVDALAKELQLSEFEAFEYRSTPGLLDLLLGAQASVETSPLDALLESTVPRAMYYCSWNPWVPAR